MFKDAIKVIPLRLYKRWPYRTIRRKVPGSQFRILTRQIYENTCFIIDELCQFANNNCTRQKNIYFVISNRRSKQLHIYTFCDFQRDIINWFILQLSIFLIDIYSLVNINAFVLKRSEYTFYLFKPKYRKHKTFLIEYFYIHWLWIFQNTRKWK